MAELLRSTSKPALINGSGISSLRKSSCRHVSFEHHSKRRSDLSDIDSDIYQGRHHPYCFTCCVWACIATFALGTLLIIIGISYIAFLQAGIPKMTVRRLNITTLHVDNSQQMDAVLSLKVRLSNKNEKLTLLYGTLTADIASEEVELGRTKVSGLSQKPQSDTDLDLKINVNHANVDADAVKEITSDLKVHEMVFDLYVKGRIGFRVGTLQMTAVPFLSSCRGVKKMDVDFGREPACDIRMFAFRPSNN